MLKFPATAIIQKPPCPLTSHTIPLENKGLTETSISVYTNPMFFREKNSDDTVDEFWKEFEEKVGETVLAKSAGRYMKGWDEYPEPLWGLVVATSGGFRFHHFPNEGSILGFVRTSSNRKPPKEKTFFIPRETMISVEHIQEKRWWKRILSSPFPLLIIRFQMNDTEKEVSLEVDREVAVMAEILKGLFTTA